MVKTRIIKFLQIQEELGLLDIINGIENDFEKRLLVQKIFYILTKFDFYINVKFNFYKYGPYSPDLADFYFDSLEINIERNETLYNYQFNEREKEILQKVKNVLDAWGTDVKRWEYYSSLLYIHEDMYFSKWNIDSVEAKLARDKPKLYDIYKFKTALQDLKKLGLIKKH